MLGPKIAAICTFIWRNFERNLFTKTDLNKRFLPKPMTTTGWKGTPKGVKITMNWSPPRWVPIYLMIFENQNFSKNFGSLRIFFCLTKHKKLDKSCFLEKFFLFLKKKIVSLKKNSKKNFVTGTQCGGFQFIVILTS